MKRILIIISVVLFIVSCSESFAPSMAEVSFGASTENARSLSRTMPEFKADELYWYYTAEKTDGNGLDDGAASAETPVNEGKTGLAGVGSFAYGEWKFTLFGYTGYDSGSKTATGLAYKGDASVTISSVTTTVTVPVSAMITDTGKGYLQISEVGEGLVLTEKGTAVSSYSGILAKVIFRKVSDGSETAKYISESDGAYNAELSSGDYSVTVRFLEGTMKDVNGNYWDGTELGSETIYMTVCDNLTTVLSGEVERDKYTISFDANGGNYVADIIYTVGESVELPTATKESTSEDSTQSVSVTSADSTTTKEVSDKLYRTATTTTSYTFKGWKKAGDDDSALITSLDTTSAEDINLVAVWTESNYYSTSRIKGKNLSAGDVFTLGTVGSSSDYSDYAGKGVTWKVLEVDTTNQRALVISEKILTTMQPYTKATSSTENTYPYTWSGCDIYTWLNGTFITEYGLSEVMMVNVSHVTEAGSGSSTQTEETTSEAVFLLSFTEAKKYFETGDESTTSEKVENKKAQATALDGTTDLRWWLRTPGTGSNYKIRNVRGSDNGSGGFGTTDEDGEEVFELNGIRPAFWIKL